MKDKKNYYVSALVVEKGLRDIISIKFDNIHSANCFIFNKMQEQNSYQRYFFKDFLILESI